MCDECDGQCICDAMTDEDGGLEDEGQASLIIDSMDAALINNALNFVISQGYGDREYLRLQKRIQQVFGFEG